MSGRARRRPTWKDGRQKKLREDLRKLEKQQANQNKETKDYVRFGKY